MRLVAVVLACFVAVSCGGIEIKRGETSHARREIPPGPGLFTGSEGEFVLYRLNEEPGEDD